MTARRAAFAVLVTAGLAAPGLAHAAQASTPGCGTGATQLRSDFVVGASSDTRNVKAGGQWASDLMVSRKVQQALVPASDVSVTVTLRLSDGHLVSGEGRTDSLGRARLDLAIPRTAAAGYASVIWSASEQIDAPCGPRVDTYGEHSAARAVRITR
jgi:hypothetical protein